MGNDVKFLCSCSDEENKFTNKNEYTINETTYNHNTVPEDKSKLDITGLDFKVAKNRRTDVNLDTGVGEPFSNRAFDSIYEEKDNLIESTITYNDKSEYIGTVLKAQRHGKGIYKGIDGLIYEGEWKNDLYEGLGSLTYTDSSKYTGNFKQGKKEGKGKYEAGKIIYEGEFLNDMKHSLGKESYPDGSFYVGSFFMGFKNGDGMYSLIDGSVYIGEFKSDNINGKGTFKWVDDKTYSGEWKDNTLHGYGVLNKMGKIYMGYFQNNNKHGLGKYYYKGDKENYLVGNFKENALYGLTLNFINDKMDKLMIMEKNKVKKTLNIQEVEAVKLTEEYSKLLDFLGNVHTLE